MMSNIDSMLREVRVEDAIGMVLAHDLTQIIPGKFKGRLFKKGHIITENDIPSLLNIGKEHIYILDLQEGFLHEDDAALRMAHVIAGENVTLSEPHEGKVALKSAIHGLAKIERSLVDAVNELGEIALATVRTNTVVKPGQALVGTRVIPLIVPAAKIAEVERLAVDGRTEGGAVTVKPFLPFKVGLLTTGGEVYSGRIQDKFGPVVKEKIAGFGSEVVEQRFAPDDSEIIVREISYFARRQYDMILITGGMSVDPDDRTPGAIRRAGARVVSYGTPMLPGSMLMMAYIGNTPILGLPGCVMHDPYTSFDVLLPRILAGETIERRDIVELGYGGMYGC